MNRGILQKVLPHLVAVLIFLVTAVIYCSPALQGKVVQQSDILHWKAANQQSVEYKATHGHYPLWTNALFSGMPTFMIAYDSGNALPWFFHNVITLWLPTPIQFFFLACVCFYFLSQVLRINSLIGILGSLAFAYATYNPVIISVGHDTKMWSIAYMPALTASVLLIFRKRYLTGGALTALFTGILVAMNHLQIAYYLMLILAIMTICFVVSWIKSKDFKHIFLVAGITLLAGLTGIGTNIVSIATTYDYQKYTIRGGASPLEEAGEETARTGLDKDYAFSYSMKTSEPLVMLFPRMYGGSNEKEELAAEKSATIRTLRTFPAQLQQQLPVIYYWGGLTETGIGTSGPPYAGAVICFLAILGLFLIDNRYKWWLVSGTVLSILLSMGSFFESFNYFLYEHLPFYNKFRAPSMALVIANFLLPVMAILSLQAMVDRYKENTLWKDLKKGLIATGALFVVAFILYNSFEFMGARDRELLGMVQNMNQPQLQDMIMQYINALKEDRQTLMMNDILRAFLYIALSAAILWLMIRQKLAVRYAIIGLIVLAFIDLIQIDVHYLSKENYVAKSNTEIPMSAIDRQIKADTTYYRVFNMAGNRYNENITSAHHNSIGGYSAAKLLIYQDLINHQLGQDPNPVVVNMLNAKYILQPDQSGRQNVMLNTEAAGPAWFAEDIRFVASPREAMEALSQLESVKTAVIESKYQSSVGAITPDSTASIRLINNDNDYILYETNAAADQFAVLSEVYYPAGWKAYIDGQETTIFNVNYALRGVNIPAGKHQLELKFEPESYYSSKKVATAASVLTVLLLLGAIAINVRKWSTPYTS